MPTEKAIAGKRSHNQNQIQNQYQIQIQLQLQRKTGPQAGAAVGGGCVSALKRESLSGERDEQPFCFGSSPRHGRISHRRPESERWNGAAIGPSATASRIEQQNPVICRQAGHWAWRKK